LKPARVDHIGGCRAQWLEPIMRIAYLINQYPKVSHTFIRREIAALELEGVLVERISVRATPVGALVDPADVEERGRTTALLDAGAGGLVRAGLRLGFSHPAAFLRALRLAVRCGRRSERGILVHLVYLLEACELLRIVERTGCRHIHAHFGTNSAAVAMLARELGGPTWSMTVHGPEEFDGPRAISLSEKIGRASAVVAISSFCKSQLQRWCGFEHWSKIHIVRCGLDHEFLEAAAEPIPPVPRLVFVGRLCEQKGPLLLIEAAGELKRRGTPFELLIIGDGELRGQVQHRVDELGLGEQVCLAGSKTNVEVREAIAGARALVLPSFAEGLPVVIMEAMALRRPVISTYIAGIPELLDNGTGWLVPAGDVAALVEAIEAVASASQAALAESGSAARQRVRAAHDIRTSARQLKTVFGSCIQNEEHYVTCAASPAPSATLTR
jgi:colanic acid/amylovoran biosynthesis glycosyltransferase